MPPVTMRPPVRGRAGADALVSEDQFERWVLQLAGLYRWRGYHTRKSYGNVMGVARLDAFGWPDWAFWHPQKGLFLLRELKSQTGRVRASQRCVLEELRACGVNAKIWRPSDQAEILATFSA